MLHRRSTPFWRDVRFVRVASQALFLLAVVLLIYFFVNNMLFNLAKRGMNLGFDFLRVPASFALGESVIDFDPSHSYGRAFLAGLLNTLKVALIGIPLATIVGILIGIAVTTLSGIPMGVTNLPTDWVSAPPSLAPTLFQLDLMGALTPALITVIFSLFFADLFDTIGTFVGVAGKAGLMDKEGNLKGGSKALVADSAGTIIGALFGTSNTTTYVESAAGVSAGGRTGLTAVTVAVFFLLAAFFAPIALAVPAAATAPALIIVGIFMAAPLLQINLQDFTEALPAVITALMMPFSFSIATGLALGFIAYVVLNVLVGKAKQVHWMMYVLTAFFLYYFYTHA